MSIGYNKITLVGNLGDKPELKFTQSGTPLATFSIATTEKYMDKSGESKDRTDWHKIAVWGKQGQIVSDYLDKGRKVLVAGKLRNNNWESKEGVKHKDYEILADKVLFLDNNGQNKTPKNIYKHENDVTVENGDIPF